MSDLLRFESSCLPTGISQSASGSRDSCVRLWGPFYTGSFLQRMNRCRITGNERTFAIASVGHGEPGEAWGSGIDATNGGSPVPAALEAPLPRHTRPRMFTSPEADARCMKKKKTFRCFKSLISRADVSPARPTAPECTVQVMAEEPQTPSNKGFGSEILKIFGGGGSGSAPAGGLKKTTRGE
jgi:hypothetical protein